MPTGAPDIAARLLARSPDRRRPQVMYHRWESLLFLHWRLPAARVQQTLPAGVAVDTFEGDAYVAVVPFFMRNVRPVGTPPVPWISHFLELNVRTYVVDAEGLPGVWFYSLDCNQPLAVIAARLFTGLRYMHAEMSARRGEFIDYTCRRRGTKQIARYLYRGTGTAREADPESLEFFMLERDYLFARRGRSLVRGQVSHAPYRFRPAELDQYSPVPAQLAGFSEVTDSPAHVCYVDGFDVNVFAPEKIA